jgi:lysophospholipase L1-like esterase
MGSCFSEHMYKKLDYFKFPATGNPFGILYNPIAIEKVITNGINDYEYSKSDLFFLNEQWHCFDAHSDLSSTDYATSLTQLNAAVSSIDKELTKASHLIITLGTAWVYRHIESDSVVGNCHKVPQKKFLKELLSVKQIMASLENTIALVKSLNPNIKFIFSVSPIRHLKDGFEENSRSKAHLITAIQGLTDKRAGIFYFPSFEIMIDDLRDYRFYEKDMVHPNSIAIDYIWQQFKEAWIHPDNYAIMEEVENVQKGLAHKPFNPDSVQHKNFLTELNSKIQYLKEHHNISF